MGVVNFINIYTVIKPAITCMIIKVMKYNQFAPGMAMEETARSGIKLMNRNTDEIIIYVRTGFFA